MNSVGVEADRVKREGEIIAREVFDDDATNVWVVAARFAVDAGPVRAARVLEV